MTQDSRHLMELRAVGDGVGWFAKAKIPPATLLLNEEPCLKIPHQALIAETIMLAFNKLTPIQKESYLELYAYERKAIHRLTQAKWDTMSKENRKVVSICLTNYWKMGSTGVLWLLASRFNHACVPNVGSAGNEYFTLREVKESEELVLDYIASSRMLRQERMKILQDGWGFVCECGACTDEESDRRRARLRSLRNDIKNAVVFDEDMVRSNLRRIEEMMELLQAEGLIGDVLTECFYRGLKFSFKLTDKTEFLRWLKKMYGRMKAYCPRGPEYERVAECIAEVEAGQISALTVLWVNSIRNV